MKSWLAGLMLVVGAQVVAQGWVDRTGPGGPSPRYGHSMCYDPVRGYVLMVGGVSSSPCNALADAWSWDGVQWVNRGATPCSLGKLLFHAGLGKLLLVCGDVTNLNLTMTAWEWDGVNWINPIALPLFPDYSGMPCLGGYGPAAVGYDPNRQEAVVVGILGANSYIQAFAVLNAQGWSSRTNLSPLPITPQAMAWDASAGRLVAAFDYSGVNFVEWSGYGWVQRSTVDRVPLLGAIGSASPTGRIVLLDGDPAWGQPSPHHTWTYANGVATRLVTGMAPTPRIYTAMAFDASRSKYVVFGGYNAYNSAGHYGDTWEFDLGPSPSFTQYGAGCVGSRGIPHLQAQTNSVPRTGTTFSARVANLPWNAPTFLLFGLSNTTSAGLPLPFDLGIAGAPGCTLLASIDDIQAMTNVLGTAVWSLPVPTLAGAQFYVQTVTFEPAANALGVVLSNGGEGMLGF